MLARLSILGIEVFALELGLGRDEEEVEAFGWPHTTFTLFGDSEYDEDADDEDGWDALEEWPEDEQDWVVADE